MIGVGIIVLDAILVEDDETHARSASRRGARNLSADREHAHDRGRRDRRLVLRPRRRPHAETKSHEGPWRVTRVGPDRRGKHHWRGPLRHRRLLGRRRTARAGQPGIRNRRENHWRRSFRRRSRSCFIDGSWEWRRSGPREARDSSRPQLRIYDPMANDIDPSNPPNEFPDIVGPHPANPILARFRPFIPPHARLRELTPLPLIMGTLLGMVFGASSLYLVLKVGLTVSASIPVAVLSITFFRFLSWISRNKIRNATILENNIVQTAGSAGESIAFGLGVTMPAIMILGFDLEITRVMLVAILGGLIGILMMIPLRRALIVQQHGYLKYPEGTACAEVLKAAASPESRDAAHAGDAVARAAADEAVSGGKIIIGGFAIGFIYYGLQQIFKIMKEVPEKVFGKPFEGASISLENNPALLGVGYIIGPRISALMMGGGVLSYLVLIPAIKYFGSAGTLPLAPETDAQHRRHVGRADSEALHSLHRRGRGRRRRHYQSLSLDPAHLARIERRARRSAQLRCRPRKRAAHGSGPLDEMGDRRDHRLARRHHDRAAIEPAL